MTTIVKTTLIKDDNLIIHYGKDTIPQTQFILLTPSLAKEFLKEIRLFLKE